MNFRVDILGMKPSERHEGDETYLGVLNCSLGLLWWLSSKESTCNAGTAGDSDLIPG